MADHAALRVAVRNMVGDVRGAKYDDTLVTQLLNDGLRELALITRNYDVQTTLAITAPGPTSLPADFISMNRVMYNDNPLWMLSYRQVRQYRDTTSSTPSFYVIKGNQIQLYPHPSSSLTLDIDYTAVPAVLSADADELDESLGHFREQFVKYFAARELAVIGQDFEASQHWAGQLGVVEMRAREAANLEDSYENLQVYPVGSMARDYGGVDFG